MNSKPVGIIAEDISDVNTIKVLIQRICGNNVSEKHSLGHGCGRIVGKCESWAKTLYQRGCDLLIIIHDSDNNPVKEIYDKISKELNNSPFSKYLICIPIQELEAWLLSDPNGIKSAMKLRDTPKIKSDPQNISSPKEYLESVIRITSHKTKIYINTKHNEIIAKEISISEINKKCGSFRPFYKFITDNIVYKY